MSVLTLALCVRLSWLLSAFKCTLNHFTSSSSSSSLTISLSFTLVWSLAYTEITSDHNDFRLEVCGNVFFIPVRSQSHIRVPIIPVPVPELHHVHSHSRGRNGNPEFPFPMYTSTLDLIYDLFVYFTAYQCCGCSLFV